MTLSDNTILITGATSGLGLAFAEELYGRGNTVIVCGRRKDRLKELETRFPGMVTRMCDVSNTQERVDLAKWTVANFTGLNVLINNAGIQLVADLTKSTDIASIKSEIDTNLVAPIHLGSLLAEHLASKPNGAIVNITSGLAFSPLAFVPVYCATKAALHSFTLSQRHQFHGTSLKVFEIAPPSVDTELGHQRRSNKSETHGGIPVKQFLDEAMDALEEDRLEALIGNAKHISANPAEMFARMNAVLP